jgi:hypothetical protein
MNKIIEYSMEKYFKIRAIKSSSWIKKQVDTQKYILLKNVLIAQNTLFGKEHFFGSIKSIKDFQKKVPISTYEDLYPYIKKMIEGQSDILWAKKITMFAKSSGTTNDTSKYIPVSLDGLTENHYKGGKDLYTSFFIQYPKNNLLRDKGCVFSLGGSMSSHSNDLQIGDISALLMSNIPIWAKAYREPSIKVALIKDWKSKIPAMIQDTIGKNITHISGVPTWFVSLFDEMKKTNSYTTLRDVWPNLELFIHGAVSFRPYEKIFKDLLPFDDMKYLEVYSASEGFFAFQDDLTIKGEMLLLTNHGIFYEFIPMDSYWKSNQKIVTLADVGVGLNYAMIITTNSGLWRYDIGDTVMFTSKTPYRIKITGRTKQCINTFGEELMVGNTDQGVAETSQKHDCVVAHYTAAPIFMDKHGKGGHQWVIEFKKKPMDVALFQKDLDLCLRKLNSDYDAKRQNNIALQELKIKIVSEGIFIKWLEKKGKLGGQHKVPKLSNERNHVQEILDLAY